MRLPATFIVPPGSKPPALVIGGEVEYEIKPLPDGGYILIIRPKPKPKK